MKLSKYIKISFIAFLLTGALSCTDESLNPIPQWEAGVRGWGRGPVKTSAGDGFRGQNFKMGDLSVGSPIKFRWISHDGKITINKVELFLFFDETYKDKDGNFPIVNHGGVYGGGEGGVLFKTLEGSALGANDVDVEFTVTQQDVYNAFKNAEYDYDGDARYGKVKVFENPERPLRTAAQPFIVDGKLADAFRISWKLYSTEGRVYDSFGDGVCAEELPIANCFETWSIVK